MTNLPRERTSLFLSFNTFVSIWCDSKNNRLNRTCVHRAELKQQPAVHIHLRWYINARRTWARVLKVIFWFFRVILTFVLARFFPQRFLGRRPRFIIYIIMIYYILLYRSGSHSVKTRPAVHIVVHTINRTRAFVNFLLGVT